MAFAFHALPDSYAAPAVNPPVSDHPKAFYNVNNAQQQMSCDIKPRLTKEQHDILESHYRQQNKPNTNTKKGFAESLNVSLDKVNNWFQNRRAKAKQDAKKHVDAYSLFANQQQPASLNFSSDSDTSPSFASADYYSMMQQSAADAHLPNDLTVDHMSHFDEGQPTGLPSSSAAAATTGDQYDTCLAPRRLSADVFDSPQHLNRRTLTQEQFDAFAYNESIMQPFHHFDAFLDAYPGDGDVLHSMGPGIGSEDLKQDAFSFALSAGASLSSDDSSVPSSISEQSTFPSSNAMQEQATMSGASSDWADSRSSSVSLNTGQEASFQPMPALTQQALPVSTSQWQPGQSIPVDPNKLQQQFREAAQRQTQQQAQAQQQQQQPPHEQPMAWPADEAFVRRESQTGSVLAQQMSSFAINTPQPPQTAAFKCPPLPPADPSSSIAARRQRPRPAALGLASLRSQSHSGVSQPASPSHQAQSLAPGQQLRRIRSSNVINAVAQGRVMKSTPGSAQRSPLNWTFADAINSPIAARHLSTSSTGNLAPPTPKSPREMAIPRHEQARPTFPPWQSSAGQYSRPASISETDAEHNVPVMSTASASQQNVSSPPQTPMYHHHQQFSFGPTRTCNTVTSENTPPQSAPAAQQTFPRDVFTMPPQQPQPTPQALPTQSFPHAHQEQFINSGISEQQFQVPMTYGPAQPLAPIQFANGVPIVNAQGNLTMAFPPQMQIVHPPMPPAQSQQHQMPPQGTHFSLMTSNGTSPSMQVNAQLPKQTPAEFFVHEYSPPSDLKRSATQRKIPVDSGPKNYTFANQGPEHFEKDKAKKAQEAKSGTGSNSPSSTASSS